MILTYPQLNPIALQVTESFGIHWYGLMYFVGFIGGLKLGQYMIKHFNTIDPSSPWKHTDADDILFYIALGVVIGGRLGYVIFYQSDYYFQHPLEILALWRGGMSFHGGFLGVISAVAIFAYQRKLVWLQITDMIATPVTIGLGTGRLGNFINGELWGRPTGSDWGMIFPHVDNLARHPSQLYELALEGIALFILLWVFSRKLRPIGAISSLFLLGYGSFRFLVEFTREPDSHLGLLVLDLSMGQWLSLPMFMTGMWMLWASYQGKFQNTYFKAK